MRVLFVSNWFPPIRSGSSYYASSLAHALKARGHEVAVVTLDWGEEYAPPADTPFPTYRLPVIKLPKLPLFYNLTLMGLAFTPGNARRLRAIIAEHRTEIVHQVNHIFDTTFLSVNAARRAGIPAVGSITTPIQHENPWRQSLMEWADRFTFGTFGVKRWNGIVSLDRSVHEYVSRQYGDEARRRSVVIPFGVRMDAFAQYEDRSAPRTQRPTILHVGHIHPFRNPAKLIHAMPLVLRVVPNAQLLLAGRVDLREPVVAARQLGLTEDQVKFLGDTPHEEIVRMMKTAHLFANWVTGPYRSLGTAPMEAMMCETPVINDLPEDLFGEGTLVDGENIVLVDSKDPQSIADAIVRLLTDEGFRHRIGTGGRLFVQQCLNWERIAAQMEAFYQRVIGAQADLRV